MLFVFQKSNSDIDVYFDLSSVLFYHRGVFTRLVPISRIEIRCKIIKSNLNSQKFQQLFVRYW